ncbi:cation:proton antiporter [Kitasatospora xanthocidica]|uniref:cation:proton antiporter n=1 Tax=Kitasatospora xanthocidica TaxID=83382 RepID=UPI00167A8A4B|nr:cation:proton antiporter [Kitasatospora xanthocidica]
MLAVLIAVPAVILTCQASAWAVRRLGQPAVIGEILAGILLGPSLLGWLAPDLQHWLLPPAVLPITSSLGNLGLLVFLFLVGFELDLGSLRGHSRTAAAVSQAGILVPLALGCALAWAMYPTLAPAHTGRTAFVLFIGTALSITAFPVLARILSDRGLATTQLGALAMACAAASDAIAWCLLAGVVALCAAGSPVSALTTLALAAAVTAALVALRPGLLRLLQRAERASDELVMVTVFVGMCLTAYVTDRIGVHPLFGAFLFGAVTPRGLPALERCTARLRAVAVPILLPLFFVDTGLHTDFARLAAGPSLWLWTLAVLGAAVAGKWGSATLAARLTGCAWRPAAALGVLMNCRGLTELVVLNIGRQLGVIGTDLFSILVLMALLTTAATTPLLNLLTRGGTELARETSGGRPATPAREAAGARP